MMKPQVVPAMDRPIPQRPRTKLRVILAVGAAAFAVAVAWATFGPAERSVRLDATRLAVATVTRSTFHDFIPLRGEVVPLESIVLDVAQGGRVEEVLAEAGQVVKEGQPLLRFSDPDLELDAIARETQVIEQINTQRQLELSFETTRTGDAHAIAETEYNITRLARQVARRAPLAQHGFESQETLDQSADELAYQHRLKAIAEDAQQRDAKLIDKSEGLIHETAARLDANLASAKRMLDALVVRAPADGVLTDLDAHVGEEKAKGTRLGQLDRAGGYKLVVEVDEFYLNRVKPGQAVDVTVDGKPAALTVAKVYPQVTAGRFKVDLAWAGTPPANLRPGQAVQGRLTLGGDTPALMLPAGPFLEATGGAWAFVLDPGGKSAHRRPITLGRRTAEAVEVLGGLTEGDRVVTSEYIGLDRVERVVLSQ